MEKGRWKYPAQQARMFRDDNWGFRHKAVWIQVPLHLFAGCVVFWELTISNSQSLQFQNGRNGASHRDPRGQVLWWTSRVSSRPGTEGSHSESQVLLLPVLLLLLAVRHLSFLIPVPSFTRDTSLTPNFCVWLTHSLFLTPPLGPGDVSLLLTSLSPRTYDLLICR